MLKGLEHRNLVRYVDSGEVVVTGRVQNRYVSAGMSGHARPVPELKNRSVSSENVSARARAWTPVPQSSFPRNEGVPGSSPGVGF